MKIAVTSTGPTLDDTVEARFGRCAFFLVIHLETLDVEPIQNPNISMGGGAGIQSAQLLASKGVTTVLTGNCGPNAFQTFGAAGVQVITGVSGPVRKALEQYQAGAFSQSTGPNVESHYGMGAGGGMGRGMGGGTGGGMGRCMGGGMGSGMGRGMGGGMGRGMGGGRGRGMGGGISVLSPQSPAPSEREDLASLKKQAEDLRNQIERIEARIKDAEKKKG